MGLSKKPTLSLNQNVCIFRKWGSFKETEFIWIQEHIVSFPKSQSKNQREEWIKTNKKISFYFPEFLPLRLTWEQNSAGKTCKVSIFGDWDAFVNEENRNGPDLFFFSSNRCDWNWTLGSAFCLQHQMVRPMNAICFIGVLDFPATLSVSSPS